MTDESLKIKSLRTNSFFILHPSSFILLFTLLIFSPVCTFDFVRYDDPDHIYANPAFTPPNWSKINEFWLHPYQSIYMPLTYTTWGGIAELAWQNGKLDPHLFHLANLFLYAAALLAVYAILREIRFTPLPAALGTLLFAVHPTHVESVAWATDLKDILSGALALAALWLHLRAWRTGIRSYLVATFLFALALLSKPTIAILPLIVMILDYWLLKINPLRSLRRLAIWLAMGIAIMLIARTAQPPSIAVPIFTRPFVAGDALAFYLGHVIAPLHLAIDYGRSPQWLTQHPILWINCLIPIVVGLMLWKYSRKFLWPAFLIFVATLLPVLGLSTFDFQQHSTVADRYLYLSVLACSLAAAHIATRSPRIGASFIAILIALYGYKTFTHEWAWRDSESLFRQTLSVNPDSDIANNGMGLITGRAAMGDFDPALLNQSIVYFRRAVAANPTSAGEHANLATALLMAGKRDQVEAELEIIQKLKPGTTREEQMKELLNGKGKWYSADGVSR